MRFPRLHLLLRVLQVVRNWPVYFLNRYGFMRRGILRYKLRNSITVLSRPFAIDGSALNDVWLDDSYDPNRFGVPFDWSQCRTIVDIGGNIGTFSLFAAHHAPHATIFAAEPEPENATMFRRNMAINHFDERVTLTEAGIGKKNEIVTFHVTHKNSGGHSMFKHTENSHPIEVQIVSLRSFFETHAILSCDYLKLDCEGGEYEGLYSLTDSQLASIRFIAIEYHHFSNDPRHTGPALREFLESCGFSVHSPKKSIFFAIRTLV